MLASLMQNEYNIFNMARDFRVQAKSGPLPFGSPWLTAGKFLGSINSARAWSPPPDHDAA